MEPWLHKYINLENPLAWTNLAVLVALVVWYWPRVRKRMADYRKVEMELDLKETENEADKRSALLKSISALEKQLHEEIKRREALQRELDSLREDFQAFKMRGVEKEADYLKRIGALTKENERLRARIDGG